MQLSALICSTALLLLYGCTGPLVYNATGYVNPYGYGHHSLFEYHGGYRTHIPPYRRSYLYAHPFHKGPAWRHGIRLHYLDVLTPGLSFDGRPEWSAGSQRLYKHRQRYATGSHHSSHDLPSLRDRHFGGNRPFGSDRRFGLRPH